MRPWLPAYIHDVIHPAQATLVVKDICEIAVNRVVGREAQDMVYPAGSRVISPEDQA